MVEEMKRRQRTATRSADRRGDRLRSARGLGSHVHWDRKLDGLLAQALMSIQAIKGVEIGDGFEVAGLRGSQAHDPIGWTPRAELPEGVQPRRRHRGRHHQREPVVVRLRMKPLATLNRPVLKTVDVVTKEETLSFKERTDVTAVPAMGVVAETMMAWCWLARCSGSSVATR